MSQKLPNYLRTHRRRHGLSQAEIALLLGAASGTKVSRYENLTRMPGVLTVFAFEIVFNRPAHELFAGHYEIVRTAVQGRAKGLLQQIAEATCAAPSETALKVAFLRSIVESKPAE